MSSNDDPTKFVSPDDFAGMRGLAAGQQVFGRYRLEKMVGRGGMGVVWRARDEELDRTVALKFLPAEVAADVEAVRDLKIETKRCLDLTHPNIVRVYDFVQGSAGAAIAMEFVEGESLASRKAGNANGCLSVPDVARFTGQLCAALDYAHFKAHLLHRDLKPANLLITRDGDLKVMDFGIACSLAETRTRLTAHVSRSTSGTPLYMSPQHLMGEKPSVADDIYSLGATLYELLTGKPPFYRGDGVSLMMQVREKAPKPMAEQRADLQIIAEPIPSEWEKVILLCLAKDPLARPRSAGVVAHRLGVAIESPTGSSSGNAGYRGPPVRNTKRLVLAAGITAGLIAVGAGWYLLARTAARPPRAADRISQAAESAPPEGTVSSAAPASAGTETKRILPAPVLALGGVIVRTEPPGAEVTVGALDHGPSPLTLREVKLGTYPVRARAAGYEDWSGEVEVKPDDFTEVNAALVRSMGTLLVTSEPAGLEAELVGRVMADGSAPAGRQTLKTPQKMKLPTGAYEIIFRRAGWPEQRNTADVARNSLVESAAAFVTGTCVITSEPAGATIISGGKTIGTTPLTVPDLPPGPETAELRLTGYQPATLSGIVAARSELRLNAVLERPRTPEAGRATTLPELDLELEFVAAGTFLMGSPEGEAHRNSEEGPQTQVTLTQGYWLGKTEVTQRQYELLMGTNPSKFTEAGKDAPVENVSWTDALEFCRRVTDRERTAGRLPAGYSYTLPSEAQWEYACRAGTTTPYAGELSGLAWFDKEGGKTTHPVAQKAPNAWGLHDMHGNVWEWCLDLYADRLPGGSVTDYNGPATGSRHVYRGGGWDSDAKECRSAIRVKGSADDREDNVGFRLALSASQMASIDSIEAKPAKPGFMKSAFSSVVKVFKPGDKRADPGSSMGTLNVTISKAPPAPLRFTLTLSSTDGTAGPLDFSVDEMVTKGRTTGGAFTAKLTIPPGTYTFVVKSTGYKDVSQAGPRFGFGRKRDQVEVKAGGEKTLELELEPAKTD